jgi:peptidoglycan/LPS O-acetylase OafA/YrhL
MTRLGHIDSLRGLAALLVVYVHVGMYMLGHHLAGQGVEHQIFTIFVKYVDVGRVGVVVFFAISGFVIPFSLMSGREAPVRHFAVGRFFRLYPAYWVSIPLSIYFLQTLYGHSVSALDVGKNITMLQQFLGADSISYVYWTLQIEIIFYFVCVSLCILKILNFNSAFFVCISLIFFSVFLAFLRFYLNKKVPVAPSMAIAVMFWGYLWRGYYLERSAEAKKLALIVLLVFLMVIPVVSVMAYSHDYGFDETWYRYMNTYFAGITIFVGGTTFFQVRGVFPQYLGKISYSVYLIGPIAEEIVFRFLYPRWGSVIPGHIYAVVTILTTVALAASIYHLIEKPCIAAGKAINGRLDRLKTVPSTS